MDSTHCRSLWPEGPHGTIDGNALRAAIRKSSSRHFESDRIACPCEICLETALAAPQIHPDRYSRHLAQARPLSILGQDSSSPRMEQAPASSVEEHLNLVRTTARRASGVIRAELGPELSLYVRKRNPRLQRVEPGASARSGQGQGNEAKDGDSSRAARRECLPDDENDAVFASSSEENHVHLGTTGMANLAWDAECLLEPLAAARLKQGGLLGGMARHGFELRLDAQLEALTEEVVMSSEIEGEILDRDSVRSSIARHLGGPVAAVALAERRAEGVVEMVFDATENHQALLTAERLSGWQAALFPTGYSGMRKVRTGVWRDGSEGPMQVVFGPIGRQRVHYQVPPAERVDAEMPAFLDWFNRRNEPEGLLRAGLAHFRFVAIHPFEDGNSRVARAIADQALAQSEISGQRFYSVSSQIRKERSDYCTVLERSQKGGLDVCARRVRFLESFSRAMDGAEAVCADALRKADFWQRYSRDPFSRRQKTVHNRILDRFEGKLAARNWPRSESVRYRRRSATSVILSSAASLCAIPVAARTRAMAW